MVRPVLSDADRADVFRGLAHPVRRQVLTELRKGESTAGALRTGLKLTQPAMSQHLRILRDTGLITHRVEGRQRLYRVNTTTLKRVRRWLDQFA